MLTPEMQKVLEKYNKGLAFYKTRQWDEAIAEFKMAVDINPKDGPSKLYLERCEIFKKDPPPEDWDGVFTMTSK
jgi:tetratricopeptide (TPR) repeat protein